MDSLSETLEGFSILQITDLHEKEFGKNQRRLIKSINSLEYDVLVITGDLLSNRECTNYNSIYAVLDGLENKEHILFVPGNADPSSYDVSPTFGKSEFVSGLEERGARFVEAVDTVIVEGEEIHFVNFELAIIKNTEKVGKVNGSFGSDHASNKQYQIYQKELWDEMINRKILDSPDPVIALNHYPVPDERIEYIKADENTRWHDFDLIIAGHYHGGQIRIPFYGALFIPDPWYEPNSFFPPQDRVNGLWEYEGTKQYVSTGLGSSDAIPFLNLRIWNPPEINLLTFTRHK